MTEPLLGVAINCRFNEAVTPWERLAEHVIARRVELGHTTQQALVDASTLKLRTLGDIENARRDRYNPATLAALEQALRWTGGSVRNILEGGSPTPAGDSGADDIGFRNHDGTYTLIQAKHFTASASDDVILRVIRSNLPDEDKARIVRTVLDEQQRFAQQRADELIREVLERQ